MENKNRLVGKKIEKIYISKCKSAIIFICENGSVGAYCYADCCSYTWIEHIELPALGFPATVVSVDDLDLPGSDENHPEFDYLQVYGCKITTDRGEIIIDYRNSSNGYYGGDLVWLEDNDLFLKFDTEWIDVNSDI
jgi:hypothetical protein